VGSCIVIEALLAWKLDNHESMFGLMSPVQQLRDYLVHPTQPCGGRSRFLGSLGYCGVMHQWTWSRRDKRARPSMSRFLLIVLHCVYDVFLCVLSEFPDRHSSLGTTTAHTALRLQSLPTSRSDVQNKSHHYAGGHIVGMLHNDSSIWGTRLAEGTAKKQHP
jgi:hypothetical protein